jgi:opacity protein-like surface antigen
MKKLIIATTIITAFIAPQAFAQANNFTGLSAAVGFNLSNASTDDTIASVKTNVSDTDNNAALQVQYNAALSDTFLIGFGATANMGDMKSGKFGNNQTKLTDAYSLFVAPSYAFNNTWLGYGKLAYLNATAKNSSGVGIQFDNGLGFGFGAQMLFNKNWFGQLEYMSNSYSEKTFSATEKVKVKSDVFTLSAGYKF